VSPHLRIGLLFIGACVAVGGALAGAAHYADISLAPRSAAGTTGSQRIVLSETFAPLAAQPTPEADSTSAAAEVESTPAAIPTEAPKSVPRVRPSSVFRADGRGALACRTPGGSDFLVEWDTAKSSAVANFAGAKIPGSLTRQRIAATDMLDNLVAISREEDGHTFAMTIDDSGAMRATVDGNQSEGICRPA
jgi:hypothetical protein